MPRPKFFEHALCPPGVDPVRPGAADDVDLAEGNKHEWGDDAGPAPDGPQANRDSDATPAGWMAGTPFAQGEAPTTHIGEVRIPTIVQRP